MKIKLVVFDLDGTLISSHETIYKCTVEALRRVGTNNRLPENEFYGMIGLHFEDIFEKFGFSVPDFEKFISIYKSLYFTYIDSSAMYDGVEELINVLNRRKIKIGLLTTKAQDQADLLLKHFSLYDKFDYVMGRRPGLKHKPAPEPLLKICEDLKIDLAETMMVGDSELDVQCGKNAGTKTCAVTYGYRSKEQLEKIQPDFVVDNILEVDYIVDGK
jgi:phosphoglycolate phosphatase-like HAD superfamily hydrolase